MICSTMYYHLAMKENYIFYALKYDYFAISQYRDLQHKEINIVL